MNHIKFFEDYIDYYTEIPDITSQNLVSTDRQTFTDYEYDTLLSIIKNKFGECGSIRRDDSITLTFGKTPNKSINSVMFKIFIIKYPDDWYYMTFQHNIYWSNIRAKHFKCDQFDGLVKCIKDQIDIN